MVIGGLGAGEANIVAHNREDGIFTVDGIVVSGEISGNTIHNNGWAGIKLGSASQIAIHRNSIYSNGQRGIDLGSRGVTVNDSGDADTGANDLLNFPVINLFDVRNSPSIDYDVNLDVPSDTTGYRIEFYKNSAADSSGYGEGETYLGYVDTGSHAGGDLTFSGSFTSSSSVSVGDTISATTLRKTGTATFDITSEFSLTFSASISMPDLQVSMLVDVYNPSMLDLYSLPETDVVTTLSVTNEGDGTVDAGTIDLIIPVSSNLTFYNGDFDDGGPETEPVIFNDSASGLTFNGGSNLAFSNSGTKPANFSECSYSPSIGYDPDVTFVCVNPAGSMLAGDPDPAFSVQFRSRIQ